MNVLATCDYDGCSITAAIVEDNVISRQLHPENSWFAELVNLESFLRRNAMGAAVNVQYG